MSEQNLEAKLTPPNPELSVALEVHNSLMDRFGKYKKGSWEPTEENIISMEDDVFDRFMASKMEGYDAPDEKKMESARNVIGFANFEDKKLYMRKSLEATQEQRQTLAHEMLHLWFLRQALDEVDPYSYGVNETFIDTLALEGLNYFDLPKEERVETIDGSINNAALAKGVMEELGEDGWRNLFNACQTGEEQGIRTLMVEKFGNHPPDNIKHIDKALPKIYNEALWGRFKEFALMTYYVRQDPTFQAKNPDAVGYQQYLVVEWSGLDKKFLEELD